MIYSDIERRSLNQSEYIADMVKLEVNKMRVDLNLEQINYIDKIRAENIKENVSLQLNSYDKIQDLQKQLYDVKNHNNLLSMQLKDVNQKIFEQDISLNKLQSQLEDVKDRLNDSITSQRNVSPHISVENKNTSPHVSVENGPQPKDVVGKDKIKPQPKKKASKVCKSGYVQKEESAGIETFKFNLRPSTHECARFVAYYRDSALDDVAYDLSLDFELAQSIASKYEDFDIALKEIYILVTGLNVTM